MHLVDLKDRDVERKLNQLQIKRFEEAATRAIDLNMKPEHLNLMSITIKHFVRNTHQLSNSVDSKLIDKLIEVDHAIQSFQLREEKQPESGMNSEKTGPSQLPEPAEIISKDREYGTIASKVKENTESNRKPFFSDTISADNIQTLMLDQKVSLLKSQNSF